MSPTHGFLYGTSRAGKTTFAAHWAKAGHKLLVVTREPGPASEALGASGLEPHQWSMTVPGSPEELFALVEYSEAYLRRHHDGLVPDLVLFDGLVGLQQLIIGETAKPAREIAGVQIPAKPATGIVGEIPKGSGDVLNPEALSQAQYGVLALRTCRLLNAIDALPFSTLITSTEQLDFDEKFKIDAKGRTEKEAAGRPRKVEGFPATEGQKTKRMIAPRVSGFFLHLTFDDRAGKHFIHTRTHVDKDGVEWFANPRGLTINSQSSTIDWTGKSAYDILGGR